MSKETKNLPQTIDSQVGAFLQKSASSLDSYSVRKYDQSVFLKSAMLAIVNNSDLAECLKSEKGKLSLFNALRYAASTGLSLNPQKGKATLIGYKNKKTNEVIINYQIMKNGMIDIALESGKIEFLTSDYVKENDHFELKKSANGDDYDFRPAIKERGPVIGFYASLKLKNGMTHVKWMTIEEMEEHRDRYSAMYKFNKEKSPWFKSFDGMGVKTIMKALLRSVYISDTLDSAIGADDFLDADFTVGPGVSADSAAEKLKITEKKKLGPIKTESKEPKKNVNEKEGELL